MTPGRFVRTHRIGKAATRPVTGNCHVGVVAVEVGYQSLSHFSKAFHQVKGCLPSEYEAT